MADWNKKGQVLAEIFGGALPQGAVSCSTDVANGKDEIAFLIGETGQLIHVGMTLVQKEALERAGMLGAFGFSIVGNEIEGETPMLVSPPPTPKERLLASIAAKDKELDAVMKETAPDAQAAIEALNSGRGLLKKLRDAVEHDAALSAISGAFAELKDSGLPVSEFDAEIKALEGVEEVEKAEKTVEDSFKLAVPTMGQADQGKTVQRADGKHYEGEDAIVKIDGDKTMTPADEKERIERNPATLLNGKYVRNEKGEYRRVNEERVALVDDGVRIRFVDKQMDTFQAAIELVAAKGWGAIEVTGSEKFRHDAWLRASMAGLEVKGYEPTEQDMTLLHVEREKVKGVKDADLVAASLRSAEVMAKMGYPEVKVVDPQEQARYTGKVVHETPFHVVQAHGKTGVIHAKKSLSNDELQKALKDGVDLQVRYEKNGVVQTRAKAKTQDRGAGLER